MINVDLLKWNLSGYIIYYYKNKRKFISKYKLTLTVLFIKYYNDILLINYYEILYIYIMCSPIRNKPISIEISIAH